MANQAACCMQSHRRASVGHRWVGKEQQSTGRWWAGDGQGVYELLHDESVPLGCIQCTKWKPERDVHSLCHQQCGSTLLPLQGLCTRQHFWC